ncbi:MAG: IS66 family insertion sequence element accessory protein TnpB [Myxococcales bacterium]|nr:IS66 family insertion sequence element accessory protein TnpB [Myxococcales bacterium]
MLTLPPTVRIFVALDPVDMRKSHHALAGVVQQLGLDPLSGHLVFFTNKRRNLAKIYFFDRTGQAILFKRLSRGRYQLPIVQDGAARVEVDPAQLTMMLEGIDLRSVVRRKRYTRPTPPTPHP